MTQDSPAPSSPSWTWPLLWFVGLTALSMAAGFLPVSWEGWRPATCMPSHCFCESLRTGTVRQPVNTYSNLGFVLIGCLILGMLGRNRYQRRTGGALPHNLLNDNPIYTLVYGWAVILVGLFSMFYHASMTFVGQWFDVMAMYLLATFILLYNLARTFRWSGRLFVTLYLTSNVLLGVFLAYVPLYRRHMFGGLIGVVLLSELYDRFQRKPTIKSWLLAAAVLSLALAFTIWNLDLRGIVCAPNSVLQGHAAWHLLCGVSSGLVYLYYRSEEDAALASTS